MPILVGIDVRNSNQCDISKSNIRYLNVWCRVCVYHFQSISVDLYDDSALTVTLYHLRLMCMYTPRGLYTAKNARGIYLYIRLGYTYISGRSTYAILGPYNNANYWDYQPELAVYRVGNLVIVSDKAFWDSPHLIFYTYISTYLH